MEYLSAIVHLSDIECGKNNRAFGSGIDDGYDICADNLVKDLEEQVFEGRNVAPEKVGLVVTGDVADIGSEPEYEDARKMISRILMDTGISPEHVAIIPGNHDVNWDKCKEAFRAEFIDIPEKELAERPERLKFRRSKAKLEDFSRFLQDTCGQVCPQPETALAYESFVQLGVALVGFDTTFPSTFSDRDNYGLLQHKQVDAGKAKLGQLLAKENDLVPVALLHHCPVPLQRPPAKDGAEDNSYLQNSQETVDWLHDAGFRVILCGHSHRSIASHNLHRDQLVFVTGSFGLGARALFDRYGSGPPESNKYQIIFVHPKPGEMSEVVLRKLTRPGDFTSAWEEDDDRGRGKSSIPIALPRRDLSKPEEAAIRQQCQGEAWLAPLRGTTSYVVSVGLKNAPPSIKSVTYRLGRKCRTTACRTKNFPAEFQIDMKLAEAAKVKVEVATPAGRFKLSSISIGASS